MGDTIPKHLLLGQLRRDYILTPQGKAMIDVPGGNLIYTAVGYGLWGRKAGLVARVGEDYPRAWLEQLENLGFDIQGVNILPEAHDVRSFIAYTGQSEPATDNPVKYFSLLGLPFPKSLLGYKDTSRRLDSRIDLMPLSLRQSDVPSSYKFATAAHLCPSNFLSHTLLPAILRQEGCVTVTLAPLWGYMNPTFWDNIPSIITGLTAFISGERKIRNLFHGRTRDLWEMVEAIGSFNCELVIVTRGERGQIVYDVAGQNRWEIPAYPSTVSDPTGAGNAFCGGFLWGYCSTFDPVLATLYGNVSASMVVEGSGPYFALETLPGLAQARLEALKEMVRRV
ncbi:MAG: carbohydrate kinase family protein [Chloroflexota bacterium]